MGAIDFAHLHLHTEYSLLDGTIRIAPLMEKAQRLGMKALAITDHGAMFGAVEFYNEACKRGLKPIIGCEMYVAPAGMRDKSSTHGVQGASYHLTLLAADQTGYKNLIKLVSAAHFEGFYYRPRIDKELLAQLAKGLIALSGCWNGEVLQLISKGMREEAKNVAAFYREVMGRDNYYFEVQHQGIKEQVAPMKELCALSQEMGIPLVATNDCHYLEREDSEAHDILLCIQTGKSAKEDQRLKFQSQEYYLKSPEEMAGLFAELPQAIANSAAIAERCSVSFEFGKARLPRYAAVEGEADLDDHLRRLALDGLEKRLSALRSKRSGEGLAQLERDYQKRLQDELSLIKKMGYAGYFLVVWDFIDYARKRGIPVGPGRGSSAGSLVAYALGITDLDPIAYGLLFERFLNPERVTLPDIDIDFCMERRSEVIDYVGRKYGRENVAQIITFGTMMAKGVIRDVGRALDMPYGEVDRIAKMVPNRINITLDEAIEEEDRLRRLKESDPAVAHLLDVAKSLEGLARHASTHAAGVVISPEPLTELLPLYRGSGGETVTQFAMGDLESLGLLKMDFLGLRTLTVIQKTVDLVGKTRGETVNIDEVPLDDGLTYELLRDVRTFGVFQLESRGMRDLLRKLRPATFEDIIALVALFRPGPLASGMVDDFIKRRHGKVAAKYEVPQLEEILKETYGVIVYQEQVMQIASSLAGFTMAQADILRRAMGKKNPEEMARQREKFVDGCSQNGIERAKADKIFDLMEHFAGYGFNKSHSAAYALVAYQTAYLKAHYPQEFMASLLTSEMEDTDKIIKYLNECRDMRIDVLPPDVNESSRDFTPAGSAIRFGLAAVKNVGQSAIEAIILARGENGPFKDLGDFCDRVDLRVVNKRVIESLIKCGAFDSICKSRAQAMASFEVLIEAAQKSQKDKMNGQMDLFGLLPDCAPQAAPTSEGMAEWSESELLNYEKEALGFYITGHPLARYSQELKLFANANTQNLVEFGNGQELKIGGIVQNVKVLTTKKGDRMAFVNIEDTEGIAEVVVFPDVFRLCELHLAEDSPIFIKGSADVDGELVKIIAEKIVPLDEVKEKVSSKAHVKLVATGLSREELLELKNILRTHRGYRPVVLHFCLPGKAEILVEVSDDLRVNCNETLASSVERLFGPDSIYFD